MVKMKLWQFDSFSHTVFPCSETKILIYEKTGLTATVGIGTNLYLAKIAMDISAKHNADRMAYLNEDLYRQTLWHHVPLTDFWMLGNGTERRLHKLGIYDMYDLCQFPIEILYKEFGVNAEYIIDHAWGKEPTTIQDIKNYSINLQSCGWQTLYLRVYLVLSRIKCLNIRSLFGHLSLSRLQRCK